MLTRNLSEIMILVTVERLGLKTQGRWHEPENHFTVHMELTSISECLSLMLEKQLFWEL